MYMVRIQLSEGEEGLFERVYGDEKLLIEATDGKGIITQARDVFTGGIKHSYQELNILVQQPTEEVEVIIMNLLMEGMFVSAVKSQAIPLEQLWFTQSQVIAFAKKYKDKLWNGLCGTFLLFKKNSNIFATQDNLLVADISMCHDGLSVFNFKYEYFQFYGGGFGRCHRFVYPKPT